MVKEFLSQKGLSYKDYDVSKDPAAAQEMINRTGQRGVPVIIIDGETIIGFDRARLEQALSVRQGQHPSLGIAIADASRFTARTGPATTLGAYVGKVRPGSVAERLGLAPGDIITQMNGQLVNNAADLENALSKLTWGSHLSIAVLRGDKTFTAEGTF